MNNIIMLEDNKGEFVCYNLIEKFNGSHENSVIETENKQVKSICIKPSGVFLRLIEKGYHFSDGKNKLAIEVITEYTNNDCN